MKKIILLFALSIFSKSYFSQCATPNPVTTSASTLCAPGGAVNLNAVSALSSISWYTVATGGTSIGTSNTGANFNVNVSSTTTYYAEAFGVASSSVQTFNYTGSMQTFTAPATGVYTLQTWGAQGGNDGLIGANGGYAAGVYTLTAGQVLNIYVGGAGTGCNTSSGGGWNGGGNAGNAGCSGGGGGASDIRFGGTALGNRILVAGGGGGAGNSIQAGAGGGLTGIAGDAGGGTQAAGGAGSPAGSLGQGGNKSGDGGGGGGGYYGGGAANGDNGGGGGSSYIAGVTNGTTIAGNASMPNPAGGANITGRAGAGVIKITWSIPGCTSAQRTPVTVTVFPQPTVSITGTNALCSGQSINLAATGANTYTWSTNSNLSSISVAPTSNITYTLSGTSTAGCVSAAAASLVVTVNALPVVSISGTNALCSGQSINLTASGANTYTWSTNSNLSSISVAPTSNITYTLSGTSTAGCVSAAAASLAVTVNPLPTVSISGTTALCTGQSINLTASGANTYTWSTNSNLSSISVAPTSNTTYTLIGRSTAGCLSAAAASLAVTVNPLPTVSITGTNALCSGQSINLSASGANTYTWSTNSNLSSISVAPTSNITYTLSGTSTAGCVSAAAASLVVTVNALPVVSITGTNALCSGQSINLSASGANTYTWSTNSNLSSISVAPTSNITYTLSGTSTAGCVSAAAASLAVTVNPLPTVSITGTNALCSGQSINLSASGANTYTWSTNSNLSSISVAPTSNITYTLIGRSTAGCLSAAAASLAVTVNTLPVVSITGTNALCAGQTITLTANGANTYTWSNNSNAASIAVSPANNITYSLSGTSAAGCVGSSGATQAVTVYSLPVVSITGTNALCSGQTVTLTASFQGASSFTWNTGSNANNIAVSPTVNSTYTLNAQSAQGCSAPSASFAVTVNTLPIVNITGTNALCAGQTVTLTANGANTYTWSTNSNANSIGVTPTVSTTYSLNGRSAAGCSGNTATLAVTVYSLPTLSISGNAFICNGDAATLTVSGANTYTWNTNANTSSITVSPAANTTYTVNGTDNNGCNNTTVKTVTVNAIPQLSITGLSALCSGDSKTLTVSGSSTYTWSTGANGTSVVVTPTLSSGMYTISVSGTSTAGCTGSKIDSLLVNAIPQLTISGGSYVCNGYTLNLNVNGANTYTWSTGSNSGSIAVTPSVNTTYSVSGTSTAGCIGSSVNNVTVISIPSIAVTGNTTICLGESTTLTVNGANTYTWSSGATGSLVVFSPTTSSNYTVIGEVGAGCSDTTQTGITVNPVPSLTLTPTSATICIGESLALKADGASTYSWSNGLTTPTVVVSPTVTGTYSVIGTNTFNCNSSSNVQVTVLECTGLGKQVQGVVEVYPNPTEGILHIRGTEHANYIMMDMMGRVVEQGQGNVIDISRKARGMYMLQVTVEGRVVYQGRIVHN